jgi:hypothetical protein
VKNVGRIAESQRSAIGRYDVRVSRDGGKSLDYVHGDCTRFATPKGRTGVRVALYLGGDGETGPAILSFDMICDAFTGEEYTAISSGCSGGSWPCQESYGHDMKAGRKSHIVDGVEMII